MLIKEKRAKDLIPTAHFARAGKPAAAKRRVNRSYKDGMFRMLFNDEQKLRELYNALNDTSYGPETKITIRTLERALYMDVKNDVAFTIGDAFIVFAEHQSTLCPNMPIRMAEYAGRTFEALLGDRVFREGILKIPTPRFYVFYNGGKDCPEETLYRLSDNFLTKAPENSMELVVKLINIRYTKGARILERCGTMREYSRFIHLVGRAMEKTGVLEEAMEIALRQAGEEGILTDFLQKHGSEVLGMLFTEVTRERYGELRELDGYEKGVEQGRQQGLKALIETCKELTLDKEAARSQLEAKFGLPEAEAEEYLLQYWR